MYQIILFIHVLLALAIITLVLLQQGKGATMGAAFGSGASQTVFGSAGAGSFLLKLTGMMAIGFFATSITLGYIVSQQYHRAQQVTVLPAQPASVVPAPASNASEPTSTPSAPAPAQPSDQAQ